MSSRERMLAVAIGVAEAPPLPYLGGAVNGARAFHEWAQRLGYASQLVTDECRPVTMTRLQGALEGLLSADGTRIHRLLIYFAGHGIIQEAEEALWLLSDWYDKERAVAVEMLRRRLYKYPVDQIGIFADACRTLPPDIDAADLTHDVPLGRGPGPRSATVAIDKFIAAQDGAQAFMIPGRTPDEDRCLFSGVLLEGLWGIDRDAFSSLLPDKVTSRSLGRYLQKKVPERAHSYGLQLQPTVSPTFPEDDDVYFGDGLKVEPPAFPVWPSAAEMLSRFTPSAGPESFYELRESARGVRGTRRQLTDRLRQQQRPSTFESRSGFAVSGEAAVGIWTTRHAVAQVASRPGWWRIVPGTGRWPGFGQHNGVLGAPAPVLIEFASGTFAAATALPDFIASVMTADRGVAALVYREVHAAPEVASATEEAIGQLERGALRGGEATVLAAQLRQGNYLDPVLGIICAYLYDSIGDVASIRRLAFAYVGRGQPIPYDIALLAQLAGALRNDGLLQAAVPAVPARKPRTEQEGRVQWTHSATPAASGVVGGLWPWLRQGWALLDDPAADGSTLVLPGLIELAAEVTPARFTTLRSPGGRQLASLFDLKR